MKKRISSLIVALSAMAVIVILIVGLIAPMFTKTEVELVPFAPDVKPAGEKLNLTLPDMDDKAAVIEFAVSLYEIASEKYCTTENVAYMVQYKNEMIMGGLTIPVIGQRYDVRNGDKEYYTEFSFVVSEDEMLGGIASLASPRSTRFAEARYTDSTMDYTQSLKTFNANANKAPTYTLDDSGIYSYDVAWGGDTTELTEMAKHDYGYRLTEQDITRETVTDATVAYNEEEGYYTLVLTLDPVKASEAITIHNLRSNVENAYYTSMVQTIEIWDNGLPRSFHAVDGWEGSMVIKLASILDFRTSYYYSEDYVNIENYQYMQEYCTLMDEIPQLKTETIED